jgi:hypothetical protein
VRKTPVYIKGMHGMGDNIHQRAVMKELYPSHDIFLETSWPQIYHDFPDIKFVAKGTNLRTQLKNQERSSNMFIDLNRYSRDMRHMVISYSPEFVRRTGSVLKAMLHSAGTTDTDFTLPVPNSWFEHINKINTGGKPILIYRPLMDRREWTGCSNRNPDKQAYYELFMALNPDKYFVISIADVVDNVEWIVSEPIKADLEFHKGELCFESLAALFKSAKLAYCAPGFTAVLSKAVGTPVITVFGGYENSSSFSSGNSPYLGIDTVSPCNCFSHTHRCIKTIDIATAKNKIGDFLADIA